MPPIGLCGQSFTSQSEILSNQDTINLYPELVDDPNEGKRIHLLPTPGLDLFATCGSGPVRGKLEWNGADIVASGSKVYSVASNGTATEIGTISNVGGNATVSMAASETQLLLISDGLGYVIEAGVLTAMPDADFPDDVIKCEFADGYFIALTAELVAVADLNDAEAWDALNFTTVQAAENTLVSMIIYRKELWVFGNKVTQPFYNSGNADFPYSPSIGQQIPQGCDSAAFSPARLGSLYWMTENENGHGTIVRAVGYEPQRISNHTVESAIQGYSTIADAVGFGFQLEGHEFYQISFPTAGVTWRFDASNGLWHKALYRNTSTGEYEAHLGLYHSWTFNKHLVGSRLTGKIYEMRSPRRDDTDFRDDDGAQITRKRRCPDLNSEKKRIFYPGLRLDMVTGNGLDVASDADYYNPTVILRYSDDNGEHWSHDLEANSGPNGQNLPFVEFTRLGSGRGRVFEIEVSDPVYWAFRDGYIHNPEVGRS